MSKRREMVVLAAKGLKVPRQDQPRKYITDAAPEGTKGFTVRESSYYLRRIADGELYEVGPQPPAAAPGQTQKGGK